MNRKINYSFIVQVAEDYHYCSCEVVIKWPGSGHDANFFF